MPSRIARCNPVARRVEPVHFRKSRPYREPIALATGHVQLGRTVSHGPCAATVSGKTPDTIAFGSLHRT